jgi:hypothetical protein
LTEALTEEKPVVSTQATSINEHVVKKKTIVYETRVEETVVKVAAGKIKNRLFTKYGFLKPKPEDVQFVSLEKYYEPFMIINGRYSIDYYRKRSYSISIDEDVQEVILLNHSLRPEQSKDASRNQRTLALDGEERVIKNIEASLVLDSNNEEVTLEKLPSAPSERYPKKIMAEFGLKEPDETKDLEAIRTRIVKRPADVSRGVSEIFEVTERTMIFSPRFRVKYKHVKNKEAKTVEFDAVTAERIPQKQRKNPRDLPPMTPPPPPPPP